MGVQSDRSRFRHALFVANADCLVAIARQSNVSEPGDAYLSGAAHSQKPHSSLQGLGQNPGPGKDELRHKGHAKCTVGSQGFIMQVLVLAWPCFSMYVEVGRLVGAMDMAMAYAMHDLPSPTKTLCQT
jgi:hypothetical protein